MLMPKRFSTSFGVIACIFSFIPSNDAACTMVVRANKEGIEATRKIFGVKALDACKTDCLGANNCVAIMVKAGFCVYWDDISQIVDKAGEEVYEKSCTDPTTTPPPTTPPTTQPAPSCSMDQTPNTDASNEKLEIVGSNQEMCQLTCKSVSECKYFVYVQASATCKLYLTFSVTKSAQSGHSTGQKKQCEDGKQCCFDTSADIGISTTPSLSLTATQQSCEELCLSVTNCKASVFTGTSCKVYTNSPETTSSSGVTLFTKNCPQGASGGSLTYSDTCNKSSGLIVTPLTPLLFLLAVYLMRS